MKKLIFLSVLSLLLGFTPFSNTHTADAKANHKVVRTQDIWFQITYKSSGLWVPYGHIWVGSTVRTFTAGGIIIQANIGDVYNIYDAMFQYGASGIVNDSLMNVQLQ